MSDSTNYQHLNQLGPNTPMPNSPDDAVLETVPNPRSRTQHSAFHEGCIVESRQRLIFLMNKNYQIAIVLSLLLISGCSYNNTSKQSYRDKFPDPCTDSWYVEIEREVKLVNAETGRPPAGSPQWISALDEKYTISKNTSTEVGDTEWCHQVHQQFIGL